MADTLTFLGSIIFLTGELTSIVSDWYCNKLPTGLVTFVCKLLIVIPRVCFTSVSYNCINQKYTK